MAHMINRPTLIVVITLSTFFLGGCSGLMGETPREQANQDISTANEAVAQHNELFQQTRGTYQDVKEKIESSGGEGGDNAFQEEKDRIAEARSNLEEARSNLEDARSSLEDTQGIEELDPAVKEYATTLSEAMDAQLDAETKEIQFYDLLEEDPILENNRDEAQQLLSDAGDSYQQAENSYEKAQELANSNPDVLSPASGSTGNTSEGGSNN
jgi:tetratricopeptide (TPR) repeat protein